MRKRFFIKSKSPLTWSYKKIGIGFLGSFITIFLLFYLNSIFPMIWVIASFGASCVLAYADWDSPLAQPRSIIGGHFIASLIGLIFLNVMGNSFLSISLAVGCAVAVTILTKTIHPPAGADPIIIIQTGASFSFLFLPILVGSILITLLAIVINRLNKRDYPVFWL